MSAPMTPLTVHTMEKFNDWRMAITIAVSGMILIIAVAISLLVGLVLGFVAGSIFGFLIGALLTGLFLVKSFYYIDARIASKARPMLFGKLVNMLIGPGWIFVPLKGLLILDYEIVTGQEFALRFVVEELVPGDSSKISLPVDVYLSIDPENSVQIVQIGGLPEAIARLKDMLTKRLRRWICSEEEGPQNLTQARQMNDEAVSTILEELVKDDINRVPKEIPSQAMLGLFRKRGLTPKEQEWVREHYEPKTDQEKEELKESTREHLDFIEQARSGKRPIALHSLGLIVRKLLVDNIEPAGSTVAREEERNKARYQAEIRDIQAKGLANAAKELATVPGSSGDPVRAVFINEGTVKETVNVTRMEIPDNLAQLANGLLKPIFDGLGIRLSGDKTGK